MPNTTEHDQFDPPEQVIAPSPVHNHRPWRPMCSERSLAGGQLRGACLNDDGSAR